MQSIWITATPFDFMRWRLEGFYRTVEQEYRGAGINITIHEVDAIPHSVEGESVRYKVTATEYTYDA